MNIEDLKIIKEYQRRNPYNISKVVPLYHEGAFTPTGVFVFGHDISNEDFREQVEDFLSKYQEGNKVQSPSIDIRLLFLSTRRSMNNPYKDWGCSGSWDRIDEFMYPITYICCPFVPNELMPKKGNHEHIRPEQN